MEATFQKTHYPEIRMVDDLSETLKLSTERISIWFQNRRARFKKARKLELDQEKESIKFKPTVTYAGLFEQMMSANSYTSPNNSSSFNLSSLKNEEKFAFNTAFKAQLSDPSVNSINATDNYIDNLKSNKLYLNQHELRSKYLSYYPTYVNQTENQK